MFELRVAIEAAKMPAMIRPVTPMGSSAAMNCGNTWSVASSGLSPAGWAL